mmetsp:Transcript_17155/g.28047  ORF Transcript_17155/g.28047 Transcript_17155/m.28047 type:complete len:245 (+) Transcript_17155:1114-1848(+)
MIQWNTALALHQDPISCPTAPSNLNHLTTKVTKSRHDMSVHSRTSQHHQRVAVKQEKHLKRNQGETMHTSVDHLLPNVILRTAVHRVEIILLTAAHHVGMSLIYLEILPTPTIVHHQGMIPTTADRPLWQHPTLCSRHLLLLVTTWAPKNLAIQALCIRRCVVHPSILLHHLEKGATKQDIQRMNQVDAATCGLLTNEMKSPVKEATTLMTVMRVAIHLIVITKVIQNQIIHRRRRHHQTSGNE